MKKQKTYILLGCMAFAALSASAATSPYQGRTVGEGTFYLYNIESGMWLQNNDRRTDHFTTRAELDTRGLDIEISKEGDGYRLNPRFGANHSINGGENLYMDTNNPVTVWHFTPAEVEGVENAYVIESSDGKLGLNADGFLSGNSSTATTWQLVSREDRMAQMKAAALNSPMDVSWLVADPNFPLADERYSAWNAKFDGGNNPIAGDGKVRCNRAHESWNSTSIDMRQSITGIPNGVYRVSVQGYYRDGDGMTKFENGTEVLRTHYFANELSQPLMSTFAGGKDAQDDIHDLGAGGKWAPNSLDNASLAFFNGEYKNEGLVVTVTDGTLTIGLSKPSNDGVGADWTVFDNWTVEYFGNEGDFVSPFTGSSVDEGVFYLYNVETEQWLQNNDRRVEHFTTRAELDTRGFDVTITKEGDGYRLNPRFGGNHSINGGENLYMDTNDGVTVWHFNAAEGSRASNAYTIETSGGYLGVNADGYLSGAAENATVWQLISKAERLAMLENATEDNPVDVTWLVDCPNFAMNDERYGSWNAHFEGGGNSRGGHDKVHCNTVHESWNSNVIDMSQTITDLPNGTYRVSVQGFYRDGDGVNKYENGTEVLRTRFFANQVSKPLMSTFAGGKDAQDDNHDLGAAGKWAPNSMNNASVAFLNGEYRNEPILVAVTDGTLTIGLSKPSNDGVEADWTVFDNWKVEYLGTSINMDGILGALQEAIDEASEYSSKGTVAMNNDITEAIAAATLLLESFDISAIVEATEDLKAKTDGIKKVASVVDIIGKTIALSTEENPTGRYAESVQSATASLENATGVDELNNSLQDIRMARKSHLADKQENVYLGATPENEKQYYLYNVGQKQFFCGGSDWGAHAALGFPGIPVTIERATRTAFAIRTGLDNGSGDWLNYGGYCDTPDHSAWLFQPVEGKERVYNIVQSGNKTLGLGFNPYARTDAGDGVSFYATVGTSESDLDSEDAQWMFVTKEERDELLANASEENPVDVSYLIRMPNFSQREYGNSAWNQENGAWVFNAGTIDGRGGRREDFVFSVPNADQAFEITQTITGLPAGKYRVSVQAFYRGAARNQIEELIAEGNELPQNAILYANENDVPVASITEGMDKAPGYGWQSSVGELPDGCISAANYFQNGLYKNSVEVNVGEDGILFFGLVKEKVLSDDWLAIDNFRLCYLGESDSSGVESVSVDGDVDTRIYTLDGVEARLPLAPGIYVRAGRKFIVR